MFQKYYAMCQDGLKHAHYRYRYHIFLRIHSPFFWCDSYLDSTSQCSDQLIYLPTVPKGEYKYKEKEDKTGHLSRLIS